MLVVSKGGRNIFRKMSLGQWLSDFLVSELPEILQ